MAGRGKDDGFSGLLSGMSGIDPGLFRNESMSAQKTKKTFPTKTSAAAVASGPPSSANMGRSGVSTSPTPPSGTAMFSASTGSGTAYAGTAQQQRPAQPGKTGVSGDPFLSNQLDAFNGLDLGTGQRPMKSMAPKAPQHAATRSPPGGFSGTPPGPATASSGLSSLNNDLDDFDVLFGGKPAGGQGTTSTPPPSAASAASASAGDLVGLGFGGAGPTPTQDALTDDLFGLSSLPPSSGRAPNAASPEPVADVDGLDVFCNPVPPATAANGGSSTVHASGSGSSLAAQEEYNQILQHARSGSHSSNRGAGSRTGTGEDSFPSFEKPSPRAPRRPAPTTPSPAAAPPTTSPPQAVPRGPVPGTTPPSVASSSGGGGSFFERYGSEEQQQAGSPPQRQPSSSDYTPPAYDDVVRRQHSGRLPSAGSAGGAGGAGAAGLTVPEVKKQAEKLGKSFMSGARKLAKAAQQKAKEVQARLEEMERQNRVQHNHGSAGGSSFGAERFDEDSSPPRRQQQQQQQQRRPGSAGSGTAHHEDVPPHYYEWAATVAAISSASDRRRFLDALPDHERSTLLRLISQQGMPDPYDANGAPTANGASHHHQQQQQQQQRASSRPSTAPSVDSPRAALQQRPTSSQSKGAQDAAAAAAVATAVGSSAAAASQRQPQPPDLLDLGGTSPASPPRRQRSSKSAPAAPAAAAVAEEDDLLGMSSPSPAGRPSTSGAPQAEAAGPSLDDFLSGGAAPAQPAQQHDDIAAMFADAPRAPAAGGGGAAGGAMIDFGDEPAASVEGHEALYTAEQCVTDEPEMRRVARQRREAEKHARMQAKLAEKRQAELAEQEEQEAKVALREEYKQSINAWSNQKKDNIRALLSTMHTVVWEGSGWKAPGMTDIIDPHKVKRWYMKANLIVHPDKVKQKGGSVEQVTLADMIFDVLKQAWAKFEASELR